MDGCDEKAMGQQPSQVRREQARTDRYFIRCSPKTLTLVQCLANFHISQADSANLDEETSTGGHVQSLAPASRMVNSAKLAECGEKMRGFIELLHHPQVTDS